MIFDSNFWKRDLKRLATYLRNRRKQRRWTAASYAALERSVMVGFFAIRRLSEAFQPVDLPKSVPLLEFAPTKKKISRLFWPRLAEHFDLSAPRHVNRPLEFVCNQVIHSHVFSACFDENGRLDGVLFSSDWEKDKHAFEMKLDTLAGLFERLATAKQRFRLRFGPEKLRDCRRTRA
jgi:hypothetical protein